MSSRATEIPGDLPGDPVRADECRPGTLSRGCLGQRPIAAMGARPLGVLLTLALTEFLVDSVRELIVGFAVAAGASGERPWLEATRVRRRVTCLSSSAFGSLPGSTCADARRGHSRGHGRGQRPGRRISGRRSPASRPRREVHQRYLPRRSRVCARRSYVGAAGRAGADISRRRLVHRPWMSPTVSGSLLPS